MKQDNVVDRLFGWWYVIAAPSASAKYVPLYTRELVRKGKFMSLVLLLEFLINIPSYFVTSIASNSQLLVPLTISMFMLCIGMLLNRMGKVIAAGILVVATIECGMLSYIIGAGFTGSGLSPLAVLQFFILIQPALIAVSLFPPQMALSLGVFNCAAMIGALAFLPKDPVLTQYMHIAGFTVYFIPTINQTFAILVSLLWANTVWQEMRRADRAEEVNRLTEALAARQQTALREKQQLEESIQQIVAVHAQVANGDFHARVPLDQKNVLWSIAGSLNTLLARLQRWRQEAQQGQRTEQAIQLVLRDIQQAKKSRTAFPIRKTGTALDQLMVEIASMHQVPSHDLHKTSWPD